MTKSSIEKNEKKITSEKPISLAGPTFKELLKAFLKVKPDGEKKKKPAK